MGPETAVEDEHDSDRQEQRGSDLGRRGGNDRRTGKEGAAGFDEFDEQAARDRHLGDLTSGPRPHHQLEIHFLCIQMCYWRWIPRVSAAATAPTTAPVPACAAPTAFAALVRAHGLYHLHAEH